LQTAISAIAVTGILVTIACVILAPQLSRILLADATRGPLVVMVGLTVAFTGQGTVVYRCLQGMLKFRELVILGFISSILGLIITIPLIILFKVTGAVLSVALGAALSLLIGQLYLNWSVLKELNIRLRFIVPDKVISWKLLRFGGVNSIQVLSDALTILIIRSIMINQLGLSSNGLYQVPLGLTNRYLGIIFAVAWQYSLPKLTSLRGDHSASSKVQNDTLRMLFLMLVPLIVLILVFRNYWIPLLYSVAFLSASPLLSWQMLGDFFRAIGTSANLSLLPNERFGFFTFFTLARSTLQLIGFWVLLPYLGLLAAPAAYAVCQGLMVPVTLLWHYKKENFIYSLANWGFIARSTLVLGLTIFLTTAPTPGLVTGYLIPLFALVVWGVTALTPGEARKVLNAGHRYITRLRLLERG
jgi:PST family polysaccharide transporter